MNYLCYRLSELNDKAVNEDALTTEERDFSPTRRKVRALLREELARRLHIKPSEVQFSYNEHGKPMVEGLFFNISHSADLACFAFHDAPIGVDVQQIRPNTNAAKLAPRLFCAEQLEQLKQENFHDRNFFFCWSVAEALVKFYGTTIWQASEYPFVLKQHGVQTLFKNAPMVELFEPMAGYIGAIAYKLMA